jgi:hypothetical protein
MCGWTVWRRIIVTAAVVWFALVMWCAANPFCGGDLVFLVWFFLGLGTGAAWIVYSLAWPGVFRRRWHTIAWVAVPLTPILAFIIARAEWSLSAHVWLAEKRLREFIETGGEGPARVGTFTVESAHREGNAVFLTTGHFVFDTGGIVYLPGPSITPACVASGRVSLIHLYGPWYRFYIRD